MYEWQPRRPRAPDAPTPMQYRRKPVTAFQFDPETEEWPECIRHDGAAYVLRGNGSIREVKVGDWIVGDSTVGYVVCTPLEFAALYDKADPADLLENVSWLRGMLFAAIDAQGGSLSIDANHFWKMAGGSMSYRYERSQHEKKAVFHVSLGTVAGDAPVWTATNPHKADPLPPQTEPDPGFE